ncbi:MAG TPA: preprotein translocase subunit SecG [Candidatus Limnocylindria bacterium]
MSGTLVLPVENVLRIAQLFVSIAVGALILLQARGTGLSSTFGGESTAYRSRRGIERTLFRLTIVFIIVFISISLYGARLSSPTV